LCRKNVYPYDWANRLKKLDHPTLPPKKEFYSRLNDEHISEEDYAHAQKVWKEFEMTSFRDYHNLYNKSDVLILADVFENFTELCIDNYGLDPVWYFTSSHLAWDAAMKVTNVTLDLMTDPDMVLMIERGTIGEISTISHRYGKGYNPYMRDKFDPEQPIKYLQYLDANNLYGWAMSRDLPTGNFKWMISDELTNWKGLCEKRV